LEEELTEREEEEEEEEEGEGHWEGRCWTIEGREASERVESKGEGGGSIRGAYGTRRGQFRKWGFLKTFV
jgi:hypothetical protein